MKELKEEVLVQFPDETFVTYRNIRIFYKKLKYEYKPWFVIIHPYLPDPCYSCLGSYWGNSKEEVIQWGITEVDEFFSTHSLIRGRWLPNFLKDKKPTTRK